jgi:hypothetical protein
MPRNFNNVPNGLKYLYNKPKKINWIVIAGSRKLSHYEKYDLVFDEYDYKIRGFK